VGRTEGQKAGGAFEPVYDNTGSSDPRQTPVRLGLDIERVFVFR
jgi:hypothetical protein